MSAMSSLSATADQLIADLPPADLHRLAARIASQIGFVVIPDPFAAGDEATRRLQAPITRLKAKAAHYRAMATGYRKKLTKGVAGVSVQDAQNADRFAQDLEALLGDLSAAHEALFCARLETSVLSTLIHQLGAENAALRRLRDDLHATTNRYLCRARAAESVALNGDDFDA
jgi:hypothetical protein